MEARGRLFRKIAKAVHRRAELMNENLGRMVKSLRRGAMAPRLARVIVHSEEGPEIFSDADRVEQEASEHFCRHFTHPGEEVTVLPEWADEYTSMGQLEPGDFTPIDMEELDDWLAKSPRGKAPGPSGVTFELLRLTGSKFRKHLLKMFNRAMSSADIPDSWTRGLLIPIPKRPDADGDLSRYRPITLLEVTRKLLTMILTSRMEAALSDRLADTNLAFRQSKRATDLGMLLQRWAEYCHLSKKQLLMLLLDVAKAYDSVRPELLRLSLDRLGVPANICNLIMRLHRDRSIEVVTAHGRPVPFTQRCGLTQGDALSPLLWIIVYDPLLTKIRRERVTMARTITGAQGQENTDTLPTVRIAAVAYADDLTLVGTSRADLQATMDATAVWFDMVGVRVNTTKTELIEWPKPAQTVEPLTWRQGEASLPITRRPGESEPVRILGQYIVPDGHRASLINFLKSTAQTMAAEFERKWITDRQTQYMFRAVLIPVLAYKMQGVVLSENEITSIQAPLISMVKHKFGVPSTTPESFWFTRAGGRLTRLHAEHDRRAIEMTTRMRNGEGCVEGHNLACWIEEAAKAHMKFPGDPLAYPALAEEATKGVTGTSWWTNLVHVLARRGISIGSPALGNEEDKSIMSIFEPDWTNGEDARAYEDMYLAGIWRVEDALQLVGDQLQVRRLGRRLFWERKLRTQVNILNNAHVGTPQPSRIKGEVARKVLETAAHEREPESRPFLPNEIAQRFCELDIAGLATRAKQIEIYTDGSLQPGRQNAQAQMGFAAIFKFQLSDATAKEVTLAGATRDGPFSSTMAELMAILAVLAVLPSEARATVWCDSKAAIAYTRQLQCKSDNSWRKSPLAYVAQFYVLQIRQRQTPLVMKWIRGHQGNKGNEAADKAAKNALRQQQGRWTLRLGTLPEQRYYVCVGKSIAPYRIGGIVKRQEEARAAQRLWKAVKNANPDAEIRESDLKETLEALNWSAADPEGRWIRKNSWCRTNTRDSNIRGFVLGALFGLLPVALREWAWYPWVYEESEWHTCPCCHSETETQAHFFICEASQQVLGPEAEPPPGEEAEHSQSSEARTSGNSALRPRQDRWTLVRRIRTEPGQGVDGETAISIVPDEDLESQGPVDMWIAHVVGKRTPYVGITKDWDLGSKEAIVAEMFQYGERGNSWVVSHLAHDEEYKTVRAWSRLVRKVALRKRWQEEYMSRWLPRNDAQIRKEEASDIQPKKRRRAMRQPRPFSEKRDAGIPVSERESPAKKRAEYAKLCQVLVGDWSRGVRSRVAGRGLWSVNTKYS